MLLGCLLASGAAHAQGDDDLLAPLAPSDSKGKKKKPDAPPTTKKTKDKAKPSDDLAPLVPAAKSDLTVKLATSVSQAKLLVDGVDQGVLPVAPITLPAGEHRVEVRRPGFKDYVKTITLKGAPLELSVTLEPSAGVLAVRANVNEAEVLIDGKPAGNAPLADVTLPPGNHDIEVRRAGYESYVTRISMRAGKDYPVDATLKPLPGKTPDAVARGDRPEQTNLTPSGPSGQPSPLGAPVKEVASGGPWYGNWVVWAGVGAVVTAAAVGTAVAMNRAPQPLDSRTVCGGRDCDAVINPPAIFLPPAGIRF